MVPSNEPPPTVNDIIANRPPLCLMRTIKYVNYVLPERNLKYRGNPFSQFLVLISEAGP